MKRLLAILCVIACLCALCVPAMAAGNITVSVKAPADWTNVHLYVWDDDMNNNGGWPGTAMTKGDDGWWTLEIPAGFTNVIANNGEGAAQTYDLKMSGTADAWLTVTEQSGDKFNGVVSNDAEGNDTYAPPADPVSSVSIVGSGLPGLQSWVVEDTAGDMNKVEGQENVYTRIIPFIDPAEMEFKFFGNHKWEGSLNLGAANAGDAVAIGTPMTLTSGAGSQNIKLSVTEACTLKFTLTVTEDGGSLLVETTDEEPDEAPETPDVPTVPEGEKITVYVKFPTDWSGAAVWAWDDGKGNATSAAWPGDLYLVQGDDGWWSVQVPNWVTGILINGNGGGVQTPDIKGFETGKDIWINAYTDYQNPVFSHEVITDIGEPAQTEAPSAPTRETTGLKDNGAQNDTKGGQDLTVLLCIVGSVVIIAIAAVIFIVLKKKKAA